MSSNMSRRALLLSVLIAAPVALAFAPSGVRPLDLGVVRAGPRLGFKGAAVCARAASGGGGEAGAPPRPKKVKRVRKRKPTAPPAAPPLAPEVSAAVAAEPSPAAAPLVGDDGAGYSYKPPPFETSGGAAPPPFGGAAPSPFEPSGGAALAPSPPQVTLSFDEARVASVAAEKGARRSLVDRVIDRVDEARGDDGASTALRAMEARIPGGESEVRNVGGGWWQKRDAASGNWYFVDGASGATQWDVPRGVDVAKLAKASGAVFGLTRPPSGRQCRDHSGQPMSRVRCF